ncbi:hypothetical protein DEA98_16005 [Brucella pseudogrignonensis]|uniref:Uncharacterized protein n=1 Tax=Brucella pseudogrignonensis TaxID=419475 RepID=A0A7Y3WV49_9HYPH|nr:hypothetical protein [Brucella pseudogrignonensis]NNV19945.1 hypothetical protein [Brucella pseudogrignonensis]
MRIAMIAIAAVVALIAGIWVSGIRVVVIQPIGAIPDGITVIVSGVPNLQLVDSPDAICQRINGGVSLLCRGATAAAIANRGKILLRLPYSSILFRLSGAPDLDR